MLRSPQVRGLAEGAAPSLADKIVRRRWRGVALPATLRRRGACHVSRAPGAAMCSPFYPACPTGMAVLGVIRDEGLQGNAAHVGGHLLHVLRGLQAQHALVGDVRGVGLMLGVELVTDPASKTHAPAVSCRRLLLIGSVEPGSCLGPPQAAFPRLLPLPLADPPTCRCSCTLTLPYFAPSPGGSVHKGPLQARAPRAAELRGAVCQHPEDQAAAVLHAG